MSYGYHRLGSSVPGKKLPKMWVSHFSTLSKEQQDQVLAYEGDDTAGVMPDFGPAQAATLLTSEVTKMSRQQAVGMGYTGDQCDHCGSMKMQNTGTCMTCAECGTTTGCS